MSALPSYSPYLTPTEYLAFDEQVKEKNEYWHGQVIAMAGATIEHNRIVANMLANLYHALEATSCEVFPSDLRLWIEQTNGFTYPDLMVVCGEPQFYGNRTDTITNPKVIIEVLSPSTANYDRSDKFHAYWSIETVEEYVLIDPARIRVDYFRKAGVNLLEFHGLTNLNEVLVLKSIGVEVPLQRIYHHVNFL